MGGIAQCDGGVSLRKKNALSDTSPIAREHQRMVAQSTIEELYPFSGLHSTLDLSMVPKRSPDDTQTFLMIKHDVKALCYSISKGLELTKIR